MRKSKSVASIKLGVFVCLRKSLRQTKATFFLASTTILLLLQMAFAKAPESGFSDVKADAWYASAVKYCIEQGLMSGTSTNIFSPDADMSRAMFATVLYRMEGSPKLTKTSGFSDVSQSSWYANAVTWAAQNGIVSGYRSGLFGINDPVTREQIIAILWRYSGSPTISDNVSTLSDAVKSVSWARTNGLIQDNYLSDLKGNVSRAEVAAILRNYANIEQLAPTQNVSEIKEKVITSINIIVGNSVFSAKLYDNDTTRALTSQLPMTINMSELNGNEKYYYLQETLPTASEQVGSLRSGDLMLYGSDCLVLFYDGFSTSYNYTRLGYIKDPSGLADALGSGNVDVTFRAN